MKYLGIDYGTKKIGLALSDDGGSMAFPDRVVPNSKEGMEYIHTLIQKHTIQNVVIGHSKNNSGEDNEVMQYVYTYKKELEDEGVNVVLEPEFFTTVQAKRMSDDTLADASAAALILQSFLDKKENERA